MINRIRTRLRQFQERAELKRMIRHSPPTVRADLWAAADRYVAERPTVGVDRLSQHLIARQV
jgi:hypothetical protein